mmetsp:Transcript_6751/g.11327  ORF Transcript_6751/g.11327 Transcript_6751/m.11327 type:complete len:116 (-) Transcript_6751:78-425(-)
MLVAKWFQLTRRRIVLDPRTQKMKSIQLMSREKAAKLLQVPRKTLDDYILHVRYGKLFGFDFYRFKHLDISNLRRFVYRTRDSIKMATGEERMRSKSIEEQASSFDFLDLLRPSI